MITNILCAILIIVSCTPLPSQSTPCAEDSLFHLLDFWVGEWDVYDRNDTVVGSNRIIKILEGCAIEEHWTGSGGGKGRSLFYVDKDTRIWKQVWVTGRAKQPWGQKEKRLVHASPDSLALFQGSYLMAGQQVLDRTILVKMTDDVVHQKIQVSEDGGQNWQTTFFGVYRRR